ncbi:MAG TPA: histidine phosphatase family protein [Candidatus Nanoarchaeia archaeon]|nr:histidine phosphatase family protein [Candidatus Nanoarchaeia archaeon]
MEIFNPKENKIEKGSNVTIHAVFTRHGEKGYSTITPDTGLTEEGKKKSFATGAEREEVDMVKPYSSRTERTKETSELEAQGSPTLKKGEYRVREGLGFPLDPQSEFSQRAQKIKKDIVGETHLKKDSEEFKKLLAQASDAQTDYYLSFGDKKPDSLAPSPVEAAANLAKLIDNYSRMAKKINSGSEVDLINATHDLNLAAFLKEVLVREIDKRRTVGFDSVKDIGGAFDFNENFEVLIRTDAGGQESRALLFRGKEFEIDEKRFTELVDIYDKKNEPDK